MYEPFFGFHRRPFSTAPDPGCFFAGESVREAFSELTTCVERGQGIALLTAPAGMGKSLLCQRLIANLKGQFATIYLGNANFPTRRSLLQAILLELGDEHSRSDEAELRHTLQKRLHGLRRQHEALLLVVDEAHLFEAELLEEIRTLADIADEGQPLVRIVLSGQLELEERLTDRRFDALNQRLGTHVFLEPLTQNESAEYLHHRIEQAGGDAENVFTEAGFSIIVRASGGVPRCLNQLADHSLLLAFAADEKPVAEKTVRDALDDLKQLPLHWNDVSDPVSSSTFESTDDYDQTADDDTADAVSGVAEADSEAADATLNFAGTEDFAGTGEFSADAPTAAFEFEASSEEESVPAAASANEAADSTTCEFELPPTNAAALAAAADVFDEVDNADADLQKPTSLSPVEESSFEAAWEATYAGEEPSGKNVSASFEVASQSSTDTVSDETEPVEESGTSQADDPWFAGAPTEKATGPDKTGPDRTSPENTGSTDGNEPGDEAAVSETAILEFGAEPEPAMRSLADDNPQTDDSEQQPAGPGARGETSVEAVLSTADNVTEVFVVDHYSTLEEPLSADIAWPESEHFRREREASAITEGAATDAWSQVSLDESAQNDARSESAGEATDDTPSATEEPVAESTPATAVDTAAVGNDGQGSERQDATQQASVFEFSAQEDGSSTEAVSPQQNVATDEVSVDHVAVDAVEAELEAALPQATSDDAVVDETADDQAVAETADSEPFAGHESPETMFEFGVDPRSETDFETDQLAEATFEQAEELLSEFGSTNASSDVGNSAAEQSPADLVAQGSFAEDTLADDALAEEARDGASESESSSDVDRAAGFPVRNVDVSRSISTIDGMLEELSYDADDVGQAVDDRSDQAERPSIEIESELLRTVDHAADAAREIEDEIGATMLDICLDTQSAIYEMTQQLRHRAEATDVVEEQPDEDLPHIADMDPSIFDVVEPEAARETASEPAPPSAQTPPTDRSQPPQKRAFGTLFSDLRRRNQ